MSNLKQFAETIANFTPDEAQELLDIFRNDYDIRPLSDDIPEWAKDGYVSEEEDSKEVQTEFDVILESAGDKKLGVVKLVKEYTSLGLRDAKEMVDSAPTPIKEGISDIEAQTLKNELENAGATVTVK